MEAVTLHAASVTHFNELPVPFRAVATDLASGKPYVISGGRLSKAMRASMAVPAVFTPVEMAGHVLVDGGVVNNLPVDVVKAMGADVVIAIDVGATSDKVNAEALRTLPGILGRTYAIAQRPGQLESLKNADFGIQPDLDGFTAAQFARVAEIIPQGEEAARQAIPQLEHLRVPEETHEAMLSRRRHPPFVPPNIQSIEVTGNQRVSKAVIRGRIYTEPGETFDPEKVQKDIRRVFGVDEFEQVQFHLKPRADGTADLDYEVKEKPWGPSYLKFGLKLRSDLSEDSDWVILLNYTRMSVNQWGAMRTTINCKVFFGPSNRSVIIH